MEQLVNIFGRFHPLLVHLPIGSIILAFLFDALRLFRSYRRLQSAVQPALVFGAVSSLLSAVAGYCLSLDGGYKAETLTFHQYAGIATTVLSIALVYLRTNKRILLVERQRNLPIRFIAFIPVMVLLTMTGHWGGSLTHGEGFITDFAMNSSEQKIDPVSKLQNITNPHDAVLYRDVIQPILESKCYSCHSSSKQKGDLRLDDPALILRGGKEGLVIHAGLADSSALFSKMMLPLEHEEHMPPNEKPQPSSAEIDLIRLWINEGADFDQQIKDLRDASKAVQFVNLVAGSVQQKSWLPTHEVDRADERAIQNLKKAGAVVLPLGENSNYLHVNFTNVRMLSPNKLDLAQGITDQVVSLRFSYCTFDNPELSFLNEFENLTWLYLDHTNVTDTSFQKVEAIPSLRYLNVTFTSVSETPLTNARFPALEQLFLFQTRVSKDGVRTLQAQKPLLKIDTGSVALPKLASDTIIHRKKS